MRMAYAFVPDSISLTQQSQKHYMVSSSLCPLISFIDVSYSVSFVVKRQRPRSVGDNDLWYHRIGELVGTWSWEGPEACWKGLRASREGSVPNW